MAYSTPGPLGRTAVRALCRAALLVLVPVLLAGCCGIPPMGEGATVQESFNRTVSAAGVTALQVENVNGAVEVRRSDEPQVLVQATKRTRFGQEELNRVSISVTEGATLNVRTVHPATIAPVTVDYLILVPATVGTISIESSNGVVVADGVSAQVTARTSNGAVRVSRIGGGADLRTSNGEVAVSGANGVVTAETSNGAITVEDAAALGDLATSNGRIAANLRAVFADIRIRTSNGAVDLAIAPGLSAVIDAETSGGQITLPPGLLQVEEQTPTHLRARAGAGGHLVTVRTSSGQIRFTGEVP